MGTHDDTSMGRGSVLGDDDLRAALAAWDPGTILSVRRHGRGLNSATWLVTADRGAWIAKAVPATAAAQFTAGLTVAAHLEAAGLRAGAPRPTRDGHLTVTVATACLALLTPVAGRPLDPTDPAERRLWGATLGRAHRLLRSMARPPSVMGWHWVDPAAPHLDVACTRVSPSSPRKFTRTPRWANGSIAALNRCTHPVCRCAASPVHTATISRQ